MTDTIIAKLLKALYAKMQALEISPSIKAFKGVKYNTLANFENIDNAIRPAYCIVSRAENVVTFENIGDTVRQEYNSFRIFIGSQIANIDNLAEFKAIELCEAVRSELIGNTFEIEGVSGVIIDNINSIPVANNERGKRLDTYDIIHVRYITIKENLKKGDYE